MKRYVAESVAPITIPLSYIGAYDFLSDPQKLAGFVALVLQCVYIGVKIYNETRRKKDNENKK